MCLCVRTRVAELSEEFSTTLFGHLDVIFFSCTDHGWGVVSTLAFPTTAMDCGGVYGLKEC